MSGRRIRELALGLAVVLALVLTGCVEEGQDRRTGSPGEVLKPPEPPEVVASELAALPPGKQLPLRDGEHRMTLSMPEAYTPSAPYGKGTDDYRCFLLDPGLKKDVWLTGSNVLPGNQLVVHHVILFRVPPDQVAEAEAKDASNAGEGWTCFGGTGLSGDFSNIDDASWLAAWAPGGDETKVRDGYGVRARRRLADRDAGALQPVARQRPGHLQHPAALDERGARPDPAAHVPDARAGRAAVPPRPRRRTAVRPGRGGERRPASGSAAPATPTACCTCSAAPT